MTQEEKAKAYDEALERAKGVVEQNPLMEYLKKGIEYIFPELKESEDERIRKKLLALVEWSKSYAASGITANEAKEMISWLEKQQKPAWSEEDEKQARQIEKIVHDDGCTQKLQKQIADWLKSLKERYTWKPSDGQMKMVDEIINILSQMQLFGGRNALIDLKHDLEKLREE